MTIESPPNRSGTCHVALDALTEKIRRQDQFIAQLQADLELAREASLDRILGQLRLRETVLLHVGRDANKMLVEINEEFGGHDAIRAVTKYLFVLDNVPVPVQTREALRQAVDRGMNRW